MPSGKKSSYVLKQAGSFYLQVCLSTYDLLLLPEIAGLRKNETFLLFQS